MSTEQNTNTAVNGGSALNDGLDDWEKCRSAFVLMIKDENFMSNGKQSLRKSWAWKRQGFANEMVQQRYVDFKKGWDAKSSNAVLSGKPPGTEL